MPIRAGLLPGKLVTITEPLARPKEAPKDDPGDVYTGAAGGVQHHHCGATGAVIMTSDVQALIARIEFARARLELANMQAAYDFAVEEFGQFAARVLVRREAHRQAVEDCSCRHARRPVASLPRRRPAVSRRLMAGRRGTRA
jgi:hypothetical protein